MKKLNIRIPKLLILSSIILIVLFLGVRLEIIESNRNKINRVINNEPTVDIFSSIFGEFRQKKSSSGKSESKRILLRNEIINTSNKKGIRLNSNSVLSKTSSIDKQYIDLPNLIQRVLKSNEELLEEDQLDSKEYYKKNHYLVQFKEKISKESKSELEEFLSSTDNNFNYEEQPFPSQILHYIPQDSLLVVMTFEQSRILSTMKSWVSWIGELEAANKVHLNYNEKSIGHPVFIVLCGSSDSMLNKWESTLNNLLKSFNAVVSIQSINSKKIKSIVSCIGSGEGDNNNNKCSLISAEKFVYQWLSEQPESNFIERAGKLITSNKYAPTVIFAQNQTLVNNDRNDIPLRGKGQIISIADTGLDASHCFFSDSNVPIPYNTINLNHRKVVAYYYNSTYGDNLDYINGHGTHVCGSAVGSTQDTTWDINQYSGLASDAKLAFYDIGLGATSQDPTPPSDYAKMYQQLYDSGARIHGDSWGSISIQGYLGAYSDDAGSIDDFLYTHSDFIILRAAGNNEQYGSLLSQATAKNVITVGAEQSAHQSYLTDTLDYLNYNNDFLKWRQYIVDNFDDKYSDYTSDQCCSEMSTIKGLGKCCISFIKQAYTDLFSDSSSYNENNIASFSSKGPTHDGRIKPDIVAPGEYITSSRSNGPDTTDQCGPTGSLPNTDALLSLSGTSMATPLATAATAILRQYLTEGYYPTGEPVEDNKLIPSGSLLKALMINNAQLLNGTFMFDDGNTVPTYPQNGFQFPFTGANYVQGWGALRMSNWLYIKSTGKETNRWIAIGGLEKDAKFTEWKEPELETNFNISYCFKFKPNGSSGIPKIVATLVWTDPASYAGAKLNLVNNLDLTMSIHGSGSTQYFVGNSGGASRNDTEQESDTINNVETIIHYPTNETSYTFLVSGTNIPIGPQKFSFVFHGENGDFDWADECRQCSPDDADIACTVPNGSGSKSCKDNYEWSNCLVQTCNNGFNYNSLTQNCEEFLSYNYIIIIVAGGIMFIIICVLVFAKYKEHRESKQEVHRRADDGTGIHIRDKLPLSPITIADLYSLISPFIIRLAFSTACSLVATAASILEPFYIGQIIQEVPTTKSINDLRTQFIIIFVLAFLEFVFSTISSWVSGIANEQIVMRLQNKVFRSIMAQDIIFFQSNGAAALMNIIIVDTPMLRSALTGIMVSLATGICKFVGSLVFIFTISWKLSLAFFGAVPVLGIVTQVQAQFTKRLTRIMLFYNSKASQLGQESFSNIHVVANYCKQEKEMIKYGDLLMDVFLTARKLIINNTFAASIKWLMVESLAFVILYFGAFLVIQKQFTVGLLISFSLYIGYVIEASTTLFSVYVSFVQCQASATRVFMILRSAPKRKATIDDERLPDDSNDSSDSSDSSSYDDGDEEEEEEEESSSAFDDYSRRYHRNQNKAFDTETDSDSDGFSYGDLHSSRLSARISMGEGGENNINQIDNISVGSNNEEDSSPVKEKKSSSSPKGKKKSPSKPKSKSNQFTKNDGLTVVEMKQLTNYMDYNNCRGEIEFKNVTFVYPLRPDVKVLLNLNMKFEAGKCYGIVGPSGSGKSTILDLIARFYYVARGDVFIDGQNIELVRPNVLRSFVTCVHQNALLFEQSIFDNIGYSLDNPTKEQVIEAAKLANAHEFIEELPEKYDTVLNANGGLLSGGQKKRIAIARAIAAKRKIMLLDEITAELDPESEEAVTKSIKQLTKGHTVIMVAHKVAAVRDCDKIFVLEKGRLIEEGTHDELMSMKGKYHRMFRDDREREEEDEQLKILPTEDEIKQNNSIDSGDSISNSKNNNNTINLNQSINKDHQNNQDNQNNNNQDINNNNNNQNNNNNKDNNNNNI